MTTLNDYVEEMIPLYYNDRIKGNLGIFMAYGFN